MPPALRGNKLDQRVGNPAALRGGFRVMDFRLGTEQRVYGPGDVVVIPGGSERWFREDTEVIDFFALGRRPNYSSRGRGQTISACPEVSRHRRAVARWPALCSPSRCPSAGACDAREDHIPEPGLCRAEARPCAQATGASKPRLREVADASKGAVFMLRA